MAERSVERWDVFEVVLKGPDSGNPFKEVEVGAAFTLGYRTVEVPGFYDGEGVFRVRFSPDSVGKWTYLTRSNAPALHGQAGSFECVAAKGGNRGPVRVEKYHHFRYADGTFYSCIGTTSYAWIHQKDEVIRDTLASLRNGPFNKLRMTVFPKSYRYNEHDDPELFPFPLLKRGGSTWDGHWDSRGGRIEWEFDFQRFDVRFFRRLDDRIRDLLAIGVQADVILFHPYDRWGFARMPREVDTFYLKYVLARIGAFRNVWWSLANEWDFVRHKTIPDWEHIGRTIAENDPHRRLTSIHNGNTWFDQRHSWITHLSIQSSDLKVCKWREEYAKPAVVDEMCYEGTVADGWGNLSGQELVHRFWEVAAQGGYPGHSEVMLRDDHVMWWNRGGKLRGESPPRITFLRKIVESGPDAGIDPAPDRFQPFACGTKGDGWVLAYLGVRQPAEGVIRLTPGKRYRLTHIDPWEMTLTPASTPVVAGADGTAKLPLTSRPNQAILLEVYG